MVWFSRRGRGEQEPLSASLEEWLTEARSRSGFDREEAVLQLGRLGDPAALQVLLERANDWVPQVRIAACAAIDTFLRDEFAASWGKALTCVAALRRAGRADHSRLIAAIESFLCRPVVLASLKTSADLGSKEGRRLLFALTLRACADETERFQILRQVVTSTDIVLASWALDIAEQDKHKVRPPNLASAACVSVFAPVRARGLRMLLREESASTRSLVRAMSFDGNASVRTIAIAELGDDRDAVLQRAHAVFESDGSSGVRSVALDVLCAMEPHEAPSICESATADGAAAVRRLAYARLLSAALGSHRDHLVARALADQSARVREIAVAFVHRGACAPPLETLLDYLIRQPSSLNSLVKTAACLSPWARLRFLLAAVDYATSEHTRQRVDTELHQWIKDAARMFMAPGHADFEQMKTLWGSRRERLPADTRRGLARTLVDFKLIADKES